MANAFTMAPDARPVNEPRAAPVGTKSSGLRGLEKLFRVYTYFMLFPSPGPAESTYLPIPCVTDV